MTQELDGRIVLWGATQSAGSGALAIENEWGADVGNAEDSDPRFAELIDAWFHTNGYPVPGETWEVIGEGAGVEDLLLTVGQLPPSGYGPGWRDVLAWLKRLFCCLFGNCRPPGDPHGDDDGDGIPNNRDNDDDNDGVPDGEEDDDGDGIPNNRDLDDDNDGTLDVNEDDDGDGQPNNRDGDDDDDGIPDHEDDDDGDNVPNNNDNDDDGDSVPDDQEDDDGDGATNANDNDDDGDGTPDGQEDDDGDGLPSDADSDDDGDGDDDDDDDDGGGGGGGSGGNAFTISVGAVAIDTRPLLAWPNRTEIAPPPTGFQWSRARGGMFPVVSGFDELVGVAMGFRVSRSTSSASLDCARSTGRRYWLRTPSSLMRACRIHGT
ncbi:hypothetical protein RAS1_02260 [Phycisphaerae bacterium RAS1]|nr:hypothetical protein RAS1_02260 [Phycisphaerae bacterium RAS1]